ncbi:MAG TPA: hypothetical protein VJ203_16570 [Bacteroidales bacterium]|nr:hypothetical protein [Bacteroidales bacterium]
MRSGFPTQKNKRILFRTGVLLLLAGYNMVLPGKLFTDPVSTVIEDRYFYNHPGFNHANNLSWAEAATLAVLPNAPALDELVSVRVCNKSGYLAGMHCDGIDTVKVQLNGTRARTCPYHRLIHLTGDLAYRVNSNCYPVDSMNHLSWFVLPPVQEWYYKKRHSDYHTLPPFKTGCETGSLSNMDLIYPREETKIFIPVELNILAYRRPFYYGQTPNLTPPTCTATPCFSRGHRHNQCRSLMTA